MLDEFASITAMRNALDSRDISTKELTKEHLRRIHEHNARLNCFIGIDDEGAMQAAEKADKQIANNKVNPMTGIPIAHKDLFCTKDFPTTCASRMLSRFRPPYDATVVSKLRESGAVCLGKTNMDEFAMGSSNETSFFGPARNPWNSENVPGGSSGGSASSVAAGLVAAATGSDTGGSIRQPSGFCGVTGLKPTYGRVSRYGMIAFASSLDQGGPIARSAEDVSFMLSAMEGYDRFDSTSVDWPPTNVSSSIKTPIIGISDSSFENLSPAIASSINESQKVLERMGCKFRCVNLPYKEVAIAAYYVIACAEASTNLSRYDGVRYGHRASNYTPSSLEDLYRQSRSEGFGTEVKRRILIGTYALSVGYYDSYYLKAQKIRYLIRQSFLDAFREVDLILSPVTITTAFKIDSRTRSPIEMYLQDMFTIPVNLAGLPSLSLPCGLVNGLPVNMQLIGRHFDEATVLRTGIAFQNYTDWHLQHPNLNHGHV